MSALSGRLGAKTRTVTAPTGFHGHGEKSDGLADVNDENDVIRY